MNTSKWRSVSRSAVGRIILILFAVAVTVVITTALPGRSSSAPALRGPTETILSFTSMAGVDDPFIDNKVVRNVKGDELPWDVGTVNGMLTTDGHLVLNVTGIVFSDDPRVPPDLRGINDEEEFRAVVSCLSGREHHGGDGERPGPGHGHGLVITKNIYTDGFPATKSGDSNIDAMVELPEQCVAPIVFVVAGSENKWFAVTGAYEEEKTF